MIYDVFCVVVRYWAFLLSIVFFLWWCGQVEVSFIPLLAKYHYHIYTCPLAVASFEQSNISIHLSACTKNSMKHPIWHKSVHISKRVWEEMQMYQLLTLLVSFPILVFKHMWQPNIHMIYVSTVPIQDHRFWSHHFVHGTQFFVIFIN